MIDTSRCMARRDDADLGGERCQEPATHNTVMGRRCTRHAEDLRKALRNPNTLGNVLRTAMDGELFSGGRGRTEEEIARMIMELPS